MKTYSERLRALADLLDEDFQKNLICVLEELTIIVHSLIFQIPTGK